MFQTSAVKDERVRAALLPDDDLAERLRAALHSSRMAAAPWRRNTAASSSIDQPVAAESADVPLRLLTCPVAADLLNLPDQPFIGSAADWQSSVINRAVTASRLMMAWAADAPAADPPADSPQVDCQGPPFVSTLRIQKISASERGLADFWRKHVLECIPSSLNLKHVLHKSAMPGPCQA